MILVAHLFKPQVGHRCGNFRIDNNQGPEFHWDYFLSPSLLLFEFWLHFPLLQISFLYLGRKKLWLGALTPQLFHRRSLINSNVKNPRTGWSVILVNEIRTCRKAQEDTMFDKRKKILDSQNIEEVCDRQNDTCTASS